MKKLVPVVAVMCLVVISSCSNKINSNRGGTWTFKTVGYTATSFATGYGLVNVNNQLTAYSTDFTSLTVYFYNGLPTTGSTSTTFAGTFVVEPGVYIDSTNQVDISLETTTNGSTTLYHATGTAGQTVYVTINNNNISISGSGIELANVNNPSDSGSLNLNLIQP